MNNVKPMRRVIQSTSLRALPFIILVAVFGWCCLLAGCVAENDADDDDYIIVLNVFTPDGDNEAFEVKSKDNKEVSLKIYTRAGVLVFSIEAQRCRWDGYSLSGEPLAIGVYYYTAEVNGSSPKVSKSGFVHLYR